MIDPREFRNALGRFATGIAIVTADPGGRPSGLTVNSFTSVSLDPPLVAVCLDLRSGSREMVAEAGAFTVNILAADQDELSRRFAFDDPATRFAGLAIDPSTVGAPRLAGCLAWIDCRLEAEHPAGDHAIMLGRVAALDIGAAEAPLLYFRGGYARLAAR